MDLARFPMDLSNGQAYPLDGSEPMVAGLDEAVSLLPGYLQGDADGAMRDIVLNTITAFANWLWARIASNQNGLVSPRFPDDGGLAIWGDRRKMPRYTGESTAAYRTRLLQAPAGITPNAIRNAVTMAANAFGASVAFQEPGNDSQWFTADDPSAEAWCSFWQADNAIYWNYDPTVPNQTGGGFFAPDAYGAVFWIFIQLTAGSDATAPHWLDDASDNYADPYDFWADDTNDYGNWAFDGDPLEDQVVAIGNALKAFGVSWVLFETPYLNDAF